MKILFLGDTGYGQTSRMRMRALQRLGHDVIDVNTTDPWRRSSWLARQVQRKFNLGTIVNQINHQVRETARNYLPDLVWAEKQEFLNPETIRGLNNGGATTIHFTPDPYFSLAWKRTQLMDAAFSMFDAVVYCKTYERHEYENIGKPAIYMPLGYCDETHRPIPSTSPQWNCDYGFLGGWEPRRELFLGTLAGEGALKIWGCYWEFLVDGRWTLRRKIVLNQLAGRARYKIRRNPALAACIQGTEVLGDDYARALTGSKIGVGFLREVCPDQHTTRTFEIPACGSMLLADRTEEHQEMFKEDAEAVFFTSKEEFLDKAKFYRGSESVRSAIARAGTNRCITGRYAYIHRMSKVLDDIKKLTN